MLSKRLKEIASLISPNVNVVDVGCDHALLDIYLTMYNNNTCIASDISDKVIKNAISNVKKYKLEDKIKIIISDGLKNIKIPNDTTVVISGMGTKTIINILNNANHTNIDTLIIQSNNDLEELRRNVVKMGYYIETEKLSYDRNIYYIIIKFKKGKKKYNKHQYKYGPFILKNKDNEKYINYLIEKNNKIIKNLKIKHIIKIISLKKENYYLKKTN